MGSIPAQSEAPTSVPGSSWIPLPLLPSFIPPFPPGRESKQDGPSSPPSPEHPSTGSSAETPGQPPGRGSSQLQENAAGGGARGRPPGHLPTPSENPRRGELGPRPESLRSRACRGAQSRGPASLGEAGSPGMNGSVSGNTGTCPHGHLNKKADSSPHLGPQSPCRALACFFFPAPRPGSHQGAISLKSPERCKT